MLVVIPMRLWLVAVIVSFLASRCFLYFPGCFWMLAVVSDIKIPWHNLAHFLLCQVLPFQISPIPHFPPSGISRYAWHAPVLLVPFQEQGTHAFLMAKKGSYYQLWKEQEKSEGTSVLS